MQIKDNNKRKKVENRHIHPQQRNTILQLEKYFFLTRAKEKINLQPLSWLWTKKKREAETPLFLLMD